MDDLVRLDANEVCDRLAEDYRYSQIGRCVCGVAHDMNNLLGAVLANAELAGMDSAIGPDTQRMLGQILLAVDRSTALLETLTDVSRPDRFSVGVVEPAKLLENMASVRSYDMKRTNVELMVVSEYDGSLLADRPKLELALLYLLANALEAVVNEEDRRIKATVTRLNGNVEFSIWNSGAPIPESHVAQMFDPFYTSKQGNHKGLGLPQIEEIATLHEGSLTYDADRGFILSVPIESSLGREG